MTKPKKYLSLFVKSGVWIPILLAFLLYFPSLSYELIKYENTKLTLPSCRSLVLMLKSFYDGSQIQIFAPFFYLQSFLINSIFKENSIPSGFHIYQIVLHLISCILLFLIIKHLTKDNLAPILITSIWSIHPLNVRTVSLIDFSTHQEAAGVFILAFFYCLIKCNESSHLKIKYLLISAGLLCLLISIGSYEQYFLSPILLYIIFLNLYGKDFFNKKENIYFIIIPTFFTPLIYFTWKFFVNNGSIFTDSNELIRWTEIGGLKNIVFRTTWLLPQLITHYLKLFFFPSFLSDTQANYYKVGKTFFSFYSIFCQALTIFLILLTAILRKKLPLFSIGVCWFLITIMPILQVIPLYSIVDTSFCYIPIIGLLISTYSLLTVLIKNSKQIFFLISIICLLLFWRSSLYLPIYENSLKYLTTQARYAPNEIKIYHLSKLMVFSEEIKKPSKWANTEMIKQEISRWLKQKNLYRNVDLSDRFGPIQFLENYYLFETINHFLYGKGMHKQLNILRAKALSIKPSYIGWFLDANFLADIDMWDLVWSPLVQSIKLNPDFSKSYEEIFTNSSFISNKLNKAEGVIKNYIKLKPNYAHPFLCAGMFFSKGFKKQDIASSYFKQAISKGKKSSFNDKKLYYIAVDFFKETNDIDSLNKTYERILNIDPFDPIPYAELAKSAYEEGKYKQANSLMKKALRVNPKFLD